MFIGGIAVVRVRFTKRRFEGFFANKKFFRDLQPWKGTFVRTIASVYFQTRKDMFKCEKSN
jgi:hypothetical protein